MMRYHVYNWFLPLAGFLFIIGCAPKRAIGTRVPSAENTEAPQQAAATQAAPTEDVYTFVEQSPQFPGGEAALMEFIRKQLQYPAEAKKNNEEGRVMVQFVVTRDGAIRNAEVVRGVSRSLDQEALRIVSVMPRWNPGKQNGQPVNVRFMLPMTFVLD